MLFTVDVARHSCRQSQKSSGEGELNEKYLCAQKLNFHVRMDVLLKNMKATLLLEQARYLCGQRKTEDGF